MRINGEAASALIIDPILSLRPHAYKIPFFQRMRNWRGTSGEKMKAHITTLLNGIDSHKIMRRNIEGDKLKTITRGHAIRSICSFAWENEEQRKRRRERERTKREFKWMPFNRYNHGKIYNQRNESTTRSNVVKHKIKHLPARGFAHPVRR